MPETRTLSPKDIAEKLNTEISTINILYNRFKDIIPTEENIPTPLFPKEALDIFMRILNGSHQGLGADDIRDAVLSPGENTPPPDILLAEAFENSGDTANEITSNLTKLLEGILSSQNKIANAQERRAEAELKKALAMEGRALAEKRRLMPLQAFQRP